MLASKLAGVPIRLHTVAGLPLMETSGYKKKVLELVEKLTYKCATKVYPNSKGLYEFLVKKKYCSPQKLKVVGGGSSNGIDTGYFDPGGYDNQQRTSLRNKLGILSDEFVFIYVGRLVSNKGINELVKAYLSIFARKKNIKLLLIGPLEKELDPLRPDIERTIKQHTGIISLGYQQDVRLFFFISDALVFPSYCEGFPNVVMQAGAMGLPAIVSDINGCNEIVINGENGIVIPPKNSRALSDAMIRIVDDIAFARKMKIKARPMVLGRYVQKEMWNAILTEYKRLESKIVSKGISVTMEGLLCKQIYNRIIKLLVDIAVSLIAFILLFPIFFFTSVL